MAKKFQYQSWAVPIVPDAASDSLTCYANVVFSKTLIYQSLAWCPFTPAAAAPSGRAKLRILRQGMQFGMRAGW